MKVNICYDAQTGEIRQIDNGGAPPTMEGVAVISHELPDEQSMREFLLSSVVDVTTKEIKQRNDVGPSDIEVAALIASELSNTDQYMMPDRNVSNRDDWIAYRQQLRDLSKIDGTAAGRLLAFPLRPDGEDAAARMRAISNIQRKAD